MKRKMAGAATKAARKHPVGVKQTERNPQTVRRQTAIPTSNQTDGFRVPGFPRRFIARHSARLSGFTTATVLASFFTKDNDRVDFVASHDATKRWYLNNQLITRNESWSIRRCELYLLNTPDKCLRLPCPCPADRADWCLDVQPGQLGGGETGSGLLTVVMPWFNLSGNKTPSFEPLEIGFVFSGRKVGDTTYWWFESHHFGYGKELVKWEQKQGGPIRVEENQDEEFSATDSWISGQFIPKEKSDRTLRLSHKIRGGIDHTEGLPFVQSEETEKLAIWWEPTAKQSTPGDPFFHWKVQQSFANHTRFLQGFWKEVAQGYLDAFPPIRAGSKESAVPLPFGNWEPTEPNEDNATVEYAIELPGDFLEKGASDNDTFVSIGDWSGSKASGKLLFPHILGHHQANGAASPLGMKASLQAIAKQEYNNNPKPGPDNSIFRLRLTALEESGLLVGDGLVRERNCLRDGALEFLLAPKWSGSTSPRVTGDFILIAENEITGEPWRVQATIAREKFFQGARLAVIVDQFNIPVAEVHPGGQDALPGSEFRAATGDDPEARALPSVLIPFNGPSLQRRAVTATPPAQYALRARETSGWQRSASLSFELLQLDNVPNANAGSVIIIDPEPFLIAQVDYQPLRVANPETISALAYRSTDSLDGASWQIQDIDRLITVTLPPQGLGEAMEKRWGSPIPKRGKKHLGSRMVPERQDIVEGGLVDFRYSPPAVLQLEASYFVKRYVEPAWNLRRLMGWPGQRDPGAGAKTLEFELLYGIAAVVDHPWLRLAEITARLGALPPLTRKALPWQAVTAQSKVFELFLENQRNFVRKFRSRLAVLEVWDQRQPDGLKLTEGIRYFARVKAGDAANPAKGAQLKFPLCNDILGEDPDLAELNKVWHNPEGLAGGFAWAFESGNIYKEFWRDPKSSSGKIEDLRFSALGGWGFQTARFSADKTVMESRVTMGRTHFYMLERIGRIGVFWNKAKHVILYERVSGRTRQFSNPADEVFQDAHAGRPILRKVREHIEILEPDRAYPDFLGDAPRACGFVTACRFKSKIIPVKNTWGRDIAAWGEPAPGLAAIKREGWEVPLWQEGCDPGVYPKPQIELEVISDPEAGPAGRISVSLAQPQHIYFFTETTPGTTADVYSWNPFPWVDFCDLPEPEAPQTNPAHELNPDLSLPDAEAVEPGFERVTFPIAPSYPQVSVTSRRIEAASVLGTLRNVTMMRSLPRNGAESKGTANSAAKAIAKAQRDLREAADLQSRKFATVSAEIAKIKDLDPWPKIWAQLDANLGQDLLQTLGFDKIKDFIDVLPKGTNGASFPDSNPFQPASTHPMGYYLWEKANHTAFEFKHRIRTQVIERCAREGLKSCDALQAAGDAAASKLQAAIQDLRTTLAASWGRFDAAVDYSLAAPLQTINQGCDTLRSEINRLQLELLAPLKDFETLAGTAQNILKQLASRTDAARNALAQHQNTFDQMTGRVRTLLAKVLKPAQVDKLMAPIEKVGTTLLKNLKSGLDQLSQQTTLKDARDVLLQLENTLKVAQQTLLANGDGLIEQIRLTVTTLVTSAETLLQHVETDIGKLATEADDSLAKLYANSQGTEWTARIAKIRDGLDRWKEETTAALEKYLRAQLANPNGAIYKVIEKLDHDLDFKDWAAQVLNCFGGAKAYFEAIKERFKDDGSYKRLLDAINLHDQAKVLSELKGFFQDAGNEIGRAGAEVFERARPLWEAVRAGEELGQEATRSLRTVRALCDSLTAPGLGFNRRTVALFFDARDQLIGMTPCMGRLKELGDKLQALGIRLPTRELGDQLKAWKEKLPDFDFGKILSDLGGINFDKMVPGVKMPAWAADHIKITHGIDKPNLRAWARADLDFTFSDRTTLFSIGPLTVSLDEPRFEGRASIDAQADGSVKKTATGRLVGTWDMNVGGTPLVSFADTTVLFENGRMDFNLKPEKVKVHGLLKLVTDLTEKFKIVDEDSGLTVGLVNVGPVPVGVKAQLELPPFDMAGVTSGITGVQLGGYLELRALNDDLKFDFSIGTGFHLSRKDKPFTIIIFILGGGGWVEVDAFYRPKDNGLSVTVSIGVQASASLALNLGFLHGSVGVYLGVFASYTARTGQSSSLSLGIMLLFRGEVNVLGIVSACLALLLEAIYQSDDNGSRLLGRGTVSLSIRICWCFTIDIHKSVTYTFAGSKSSSRVTFRNHEDAIISRATPLDPADPYQVAATAYVNHLL